jgi:hypothetical protein
MWRKQGATATTLGSAVIGPRTIGMMPAQAIIPDVLLATAYEMIEQFRHFGCWHIASFRGAAEFGRYRGLADIEQAAAIKLDL